MNKLARFSDQAYALLRIVSGFLFFYHGAQKIIGIFGYSQPAFGSQLWIGGLIELVCGLLLVIGFQTRWAAFISSGTMAVAYFQLHWKVQFDAGFFPANNGGELAALYSFIFLYIACRGSGIWAIDKKE